MEKRQIIENLFDPKIIRILRLFINNPTKEFYLREISKLTKVPAASTFRILRQMKGLELLHEERIKHLKTYFLNQKNATMFTELLEDKRSAIQEFTDFIKTLQGVDMAVLNGKEEADKASILVVGEGMDLQALTAKIVDIKQKYNYNIIHLVLSKDQYRQMQSMGLYPSTKTVLYYKQMEA